jgi:hypothetical protein
MTLMGLTRRFGETKYDWFCGRVFDTRGTEFYVLLDLAESDQSKRVETTFTSSPASICSMVQQVLTQYHGGKKILIDRSPGCVDYSEGYYKIYVPLEERERAMMNAFLKIAKPSA